MKDGQSRLANAYSTWVRDENENEWVVYDRDNNEVFRFPKHWKDKDCALAMKFARKFSDESFEHGKAIGGAEKEGFYKPVLRQTDSHIRIIEAENEKLSTKLEKLILGEGDV